MQTTAEKKTVEDKTLDQIRSAIKLYFDNKDSLDCRLINVIASDSGKRIDLVFKVSAAYRVVSISDQYMSTKTLHQGYFPGYIADISIDFYSPSAQAVYLSKVHFYNKKGILCSFLPNHYNEGEFCLPDGHGIYSWNSAGSLFKNIIHCITCFWDSHFNNDAMPYLTEDLVNWFGKVLGKPLVASGAPSNCECEECLDGRAAGHYGSPQLLKSICKAGKLDWNSAPMKNVFPENMTSLTLAQATKDL